MFVQQLDAVDGRMPFRAGEGRMPRSRNLDRRIALHSQGGSEPSDEVAILRNRVGEVSVVHAKHGSERTFASVPNEAAASSRRDAGDEHHSDSLIGRSSSATKARRGSDAEQLSQERALNVASRRQIPPDRSAASQ